MKSDNRFLQELLDCGGEVVFPAINPETGTNVYDIAEPLVIRSGCSLTLDGCTLRLCDGVYSNIIISEGAWDSPRPESRGIEIIGINGATLDGGNYNGLHEKNANRDGLPHVQHNCLICFNNVHGFKISGLNCTRPRYWNFVFHYSSGGIIENINFDSDNTAPNQDGIDLRCGCHDIIIRNISGSTGDDTVALTALGNGKKFGSEGACPDIYNVKIKNVNSEVTGGHGIIRLLCQDGVKLHDVEVEDIYDRHVDLKNRKNIAAIRLGDVRYWSIKPAEYGDMSRIKINGLVTNAPIAIKVNVDVPELEISNVTEVAD